MLSERILKHRWLRAISRASASARLGLDRSLTLYVVFALVAISRVKVAILYI